MATSFTIKQNDRLPDLVATLKAGGVAADISGNTGVVFHMKPESGTIKVNAACVVVDATNGIVKYLWTAADTDTVGTFLGEFEVSFAGPKTETFPNDSNFTITVVDDLA